MINFNNITEITIPQGRVTKIQCGTNTLWEESAFNYVSLGDSIAAGHGIDPYIGNEDLWLSGIDKWQYCQANNWKPTTVQEGTYTYRLTELLKGTYGKVKTTSFARSGDQSTNLCAYFNANNHPKVSQALSTADLVTVCIGANNVLAPAIGKLGDFIKYGNPTLAYLENEMLKSYFNILSADSNASGSYKYMFKTLLRKIRPNAKIVFTEVYNPLKYLKVEESTSANRYTDGYFGWIMNQLLDIDVDVDWLDLHVHAREWLYTLTIPVDGMGELSMQYICQRINGTGGGNNTEPLSSWVERQVNEINRRLSVALAEYSQEDPEGAARISIAPTKQAFDSIPSKNWNLHEATSEAVAESLLPNYQQLVNNQVCEGRQINQAPGWDKVFGDTWVDWLTTGGALVLDYFRGNTDTMDRLIMDTIEYVLQQEIDVHPKRPGHYVLAQAFKDALDIAPFDTYSMNRYTVGYAAGTAGSNTVSGSMTAKGLVTPYQSACYIAPSPAFSVAASTGYTARHWVDSASGGSWSFNNPVKVDSSRTFTTYWSDMYQLIVRQQDVSDFKSVNWTEVGLTDWGISIPSGDNYADRQMYVSGENYSSQLERISEGGGVKDTTFEFRFGTPIGFIVNSKELKCDLYIGKVTVIERWWCDVYYAPDWGTAVSVVAKPKAFAQFTMPAEPIGIVLEYKTEGSIGNLQDPAKVCWNVYVYGHVDNFQYGEYK